jgi:hypothetical protein
MQLKISFVGAQMHEQTPDIALYALDARGHATKIATVKEGTLDVAVETGKLGSVIALGPNVADPKTLNPKAFVTLKVADQLQQWRKNPVLEIPAQWWRPWLGFRICLTGNVSKCFPFVLEKAPLLRSIAMGTATVFPPFEFCLPICNGVVEVWESTCCCFPFLLLDVPPLIRKLKTFLAENPVMFPPPPRPGVNAPVSRALTTRVDRALAAGKTDLRFLPNTELHLHLQALESSSPEEAVKYFQAHPSLWPIWCACSSAKLGETSLNPDGSFQFCFNQFLFPWLFCSHSYFYKVKQLQGGSWVYIYNGSAANQYFNADETANLNTFLGASCGTVQPPPGTNFVDLQQIGSTLSYNLHSNYAGVDGSNNDLTQNGPFSVVAPIPAGGGLVGSNNAPWCKTLSFMLYFDPGMETLGAVYYRFSVAPSDLNGNPVGPMQIIQNPIAWSKYVPVVVGGITEIEIEPVTLGPVPAVNGVNGLFRIPYNADADWLSGQAHQYFDTRTLNPAAPGIPGPGNGRFLLAVEIFDVNGKRIVPAGVTPGAGDVAAGFQFLRLMSASGPGSTANVNQAALTHLFWADNRPVVSEIDSFTLNGITSSEQCQFLSGDGTAAFQVNYRAYHAVLSDDGLPPPLIPVPNPLPPTTFMSNFTLTWERGLNGPTGTFDFGGDTDRPSTDAFGPPQPSPAANGLLSQLLPTGGPQSCSFAIVLNVYSKHTDGSGSSFSDLNGSTVAAVAISRTS